MKTHRTTAIIVGVLFIIGTVSGVLTLQPSSVLDDPDYLAKAFLSANQVIGGAALVLLMGFALSMMSVVLFPVLRRHNETLALGAVVFRGALEAFFYIAIATNWLLQLTISREYAQAGASSAAYYEALGTLLKGLSYWTDHMLAIVFTLGALMIYYVFYRARLIPRWLSAWGFIGALLYLAAPLLNVFDPQLPSLSLEAGWGRLMWPLAVQEMVFAVWLIVKGFNPAATIFSAAE